MTEIWEDVDVTVRYQYKGRLKETTISLNRQDIEDEERRRYREWFDTLSDEDKRGKNPNDVPLPDFKKRVMTHAQELVSRSIIERGDTSGEYRILPPSAIKEVVVKATPRKLVIS